MNDDNKDQSPDNTPDYKNMPLSSRQGNSKTHCNYLLDVRKNKLLKKYPNEAWESVLSNKSMILLNFLIKK